MRRLKSGRYIFGYLTLECPLGIKRTFQPHCRISAFGGKADIGTDLKWHFALAAARREVLGFSHDSSEESIFAGMANILENAPSAQEEPKLIVRKAPHAAVWSEPGDLAFQMPRGRRLNTYQKSKVRARLGLPNSLTITLLA